MRPHRFPSRPSPALSLALALGASVSAFLVAPAVPAAVAAVEDEERIAKAGEQVEILRVVLTRELNAALDAQLHARSDDPLARRNEEAAAAEALLRNQSDARQKWEQQLNATLFSDLQRQFAKDDRLGPGFQTSHTRGFYAPGIGAWFDTSIAVPLRPRQAEPSGEEDPVEDAWERARRELRNEGSVATVNRLYQVAQRVEYALDEAFMAAAEEAALGTLVRFGDRLEAMAPEDRDLVVALRFAAGKPSGVGFDGIALNPIGSVFAQSENREVRTVVIRVPRSAVLRHAAGELALEEVKALARITRY